MGSIRKFKRWLYYVLSFIENKLNDWSQRRADDERRSVKISRFIYLWIPKDISSEIKLTFAVADVDAVFKITKTEWNRFAQYVDNGCDSKFQFKSENNYILYFCAIGSDLCEFSYKKLFWNNKFRADMVSIREALRVCRECSYI